MPNNLSTKNSQKKTDNYVSLSAASKSLGVSTDTLRRWANSGKIASMRTAGGHRRFSTESIKKLQEAKKLKYQKSFKSPTKDTSNLVNLSKATLALGVSKDSIRRWEAQGKIKSIRTPGGHRRFDLDEIKKSSQQKVETIPKDDKLYPTTSTYQTIATAYYLSIFAFLIFFSLIVLKKTEPGNKLLASLGKTEIIYQIEQVDTHTHPEGDVEAAEDESTDNLLVSSYFLPVSENQFTNPSFERGDGLKGVDAAGNQNFGQPWQWTYTLSGHEGNIYVSDGAVRTDGTSIKFWDSGVGGATDPVGIMNFGITQEQTTTNNYRNYTLSGFVRNINLIGSPKLRMGLRKSGTTTVSKDFTIGSTNTGWKQLTANFENVEAGMIPFFELIDYTGGTMYLEDASMVEVAEVSQTAHRTSGVENPDSLTSVPTSLLPNYPNLPAAGTILGGGAITTDINGNLYPTVNGSGNIGGEDNRWGDGYFKNVNINDTISVTGSFSISSVNSNLLPTQDDMYDIGGTSSKWRNLYIDGTAYLDTLSVPGTTSFNALTYTWPSSHTTSGILQNDGAGTLAWSTIGAAGVTPDSLDFTEFVDAMTLDSNLTIDPTISNYSLNIDSGLLYLDTANNRVGIGTISPGAKLEINVPTATSEALILKTTDDNTTKNLFEAQNSGGSNVMYVGSTGQLYIPRLVNINYNDTFITTSGANEFEFYINNVRTMKIGISGVRINQDNAGNKDFIIDGDVNDNLFFADVGNEIIGIGESTPTAKLHVTSTAAATIGQIIKGAASQTANLQEWQDSNGNVLAAYTPNSIFYIGDFEPSQTQMGFYVTQETTNEYPRFTVESYETSATRRGLFQMMRGRGTKASPLPLVNNDQIGSFIANGIDSNGATQAAATIDFYADGTPGAGTVPMRISFVTGTNPTTRKERLKIKSDGSIILNDGGDNVTTVVPLTVKATASQTANLTEWQDSSGNVLGSIDATISKLTLNAKQIIHVPNQTDFAGTIIFGDGGTNLSHTIGQTGQNNLLFGFNAGAALTTGYENILIGADAGSSMTTGLNNMMIGATTGTSLTDEIANTFIGTRAGQTATTTNSVFIGHQTGRASNSSYSVMVGNAIGENSTGLYNVFVGHIAGQLNTTGASNVFLGYSAGEQNLTGGNNVHIGFKAGETATGSGNIFIGQDAGSDEAGSNFLYIANSNTTTPLIYGLFTGTGAGLTIHSQTTDGVPLIVKGIASQASNLQEWQDSSGNVMTNVEADGDLVLGADLATSAGVTLSGVNDGSSDPGLFVQGNRANRTTSLFLAPNGTFSAARFVLLNENVLTNVASMSLRNNTNAGIFEAARFQGTPAQDIDSMYFNIDPGNQYTGESFYFSMDAFPISGSPTVLLAIKQGNEQVLIDSQATTAVPLTIKATASQSANLTEWQDSSGNVLNLVEHDGGQVIQQQAATGTPTSSQIITAAAHTALTASTERTEINFDLSATQQFATGALATQRAMRIQAPTYGFVGASTITNAATLSISGAPIAGTNATITNTAAFVVESGNVGIGISAPTDTLHVVGNGLFTTGVHIGADGDGTLIDDASTGASSTTLYIGNESIDTTASDVRLKENIVDSEIDALGVLGGLRIVDFDWREGSIRRERGRSTGLIAQEVDEYLPQVVRKGVDPESIWSVEYQHLVPYLIKAIQEQQVQIDEIREKLAISDVSDNPEGLEIPDISDENISLNNLVVLEQAVLSDTLVNGNLSVGLLSIESDEDSASLDAIGTLKLQPLALGSIELMGGIVEIDTNGNLNIKEGQIIGNDSFRGISEVLAGKTEINIEKDWEIPPVSVQITPEYTTAYSVKGISESGFRINLAEAPDENSRIHWLAIW